MIIVNTSLDDNKLKVSSADGDNTFQVEADLKHANESAVHVWPGSMPKTPSVITTTHRQEVIEYESSMHTYSHQYH